MKKLLFFKYIFLLTFFSFTDVFAQAFPVKPIRLVIPYAAGGNTDILARIIAQKLHEVMNQPVIPDNRPGIDGVVGISLVSRSIPDGYTILMVSSSIAINTAMGMKLSYDPNKDFTPITQTASQQLILIVHSSLPVKNVQELINYSKLNKNSLSYGSSSSATQLATELLNSLAGIKMVHIPYKGAAPMITDLAGGQIQLSLSPSVVAIPHIKSGRVRALALGDIKRSSFMPDLPTINESGIPKYQATIWTGVLAPDKTPKIIIEKLNREIVRIVKHPDLSERLVLLGSDTVGSSSEEFKKFINEEIAKWTGIAKKVGLWGINP